MASTHRGRHETPRCTLGNPCDLSKPSRRASADPRVPVGTKAVRSPPARARLLAAFLALNLALVLTRAVDAVGWEWLVPGGWIGQLDPRNEYSAANAYSGVLWCAIAALGIAQLPLHTPASGPRWLWVLGWLSVALFAALLALVEITSPTDIGMLAGSAARAALKLEGLPPGARWLAVVAPLAIPLAAAAGWVLYTSQRRHSARALLTALAIALAVSSVIRDVLTGFYSTTIPWGRFLQGDPELTGEAVLRKSPFRREMVDFLEESTEIMAAAILAVVLVKMLATRHGSVPDVQGDRRRWRGGRWLAFAVGAALLAAGTLALLAEFQRKDEGWVWSRPHVYTGPVALVKQSFQADRDYLTRIEVWAFVDGGSGATAEIFARLTPAGSDRPVRESRAEVRAARFSNATVDLEFEPIPDSAGRSYDLAIGVLSEPEPYVFLGLTDGDVNPGSEVVLSGAPTRYQNDLAMGTYWVGRGGRVLEELIRSDLRRLLLIGDVAAMVFLWVFAVVTAGRGLSGYKPRFWRAFVRGAAQTSVLVTAGLATIAIALLTVLSSTPHG